MPAQTVRMPALNLDIPTYSRADHTLALPALAEGSAPLPHLLVQPQGAMPWAICETMVSASAGG